jgi:hypothetical protein
MFDTIEDTCLTQKKKTSPTQVHRKQTPLLHLTNYLLVDKRALLPYKLVIRTERILKWFGHH